MERYWHIDSSSSTTRILPMAMEISLGDRQIAVTRLISSLLGNSLTRNAKNPGRTRPGGGQEGVASLGRACRMPAPTRKNLPENRIGQDTGWQDRTPEA